MWIRRLIALITRTRPGSARPNPGEVWNAADQAAAFQRLHDQARRHQAAHRYDWPGQ